MRMAELEAVLLIGIATLIVIGARELPPPLANPNDSMMIWHVPANVDVPDTAILRVKASPGAVWAKSPRHVRRTRRENLWRQFMRDPRARNAEHSCRKYMLVTESLPVEEFACVLGERKQRLAEIP